MSPRSTVSQAPAVKAEDLLNRAAVVAVDLVKVYGEGEAAVRALDRSPTTPLPPVSPTE
ncbi:hypothetical protein BH23ACT12_BH23ACT12_00830 [soil metagenome]